MDVNLKGSHTNYHQVDPVSTDTVTVTTTPPSGVCPHCGRCPHCGSPSHPQYPAPYYPGDQWPFTYVGDAPGWFGTYTSDSLDDKHEEFKAWVF